jgi:alkanesulfonate monooxygenase SsuD/methylene tetrahydromethanopterin reductase-like flavin-dependent oxidoreductase (luciferase family)
LGIGAGWLESEYHEYGYAYPAANERLQDLAKAVPMIRERWQKEDPKPVRGSIPLLIGGDGEKVTLRIVAQYADIWNGFDPPEVFQRKNQVLDQWCEKVGRDPATLERSVVTHSWTKKRLNDLLKAGARHIILSIGEPWNISAVEKLVRWREENS